MPPQEPLENSLDSAYIIVFVKLQELLEGTLREKAGLNFTQFRVLLKSAEKEGEDCPLSDLADMLHIQPNVVTQAANELERLGYIGRVVSSRDARVKSLTVTDAGRRAIEALNVAFKDNLYSSFNPEGDPLYNSMLEACIYAAANVETSLSEHFKSKHKASAALITYDVVLSRIVDTLNDKTGVSFNECRIMQRLAEVGEPMRAVDLASQLMLPATTITRAATRLEKHGWVIRMASSSNRQAVFLAVTDEGRECQRVILETIDKASDEVLWSRMTPEQIDALGRVGAVFLESMRARDVIRRNAPVGELTPLAR